MITQPTGVEPNEAIPIDTRLRGRWLLIARVIWLALAGVSLVILFVGVPIYFNYVRTACIPSVCEESIQATAQALEAYGLSPTYNAVYHTLLSFSVIAVHLMVAAVIFYRRKYNAAKVLAAFAATARRDRFGQTDERAAARGRRDHAAGVCWGVAEGTGKNSGRSERWKTT